MRYLLIPTPVEMKARNGERMRDPSGAELKPFTLFDYSEAWWNNEELLKGGYRGRQMVEKIIAKFDKAKEDKAAYIPLEEAEWEKIKPVAENGHFFGAVWLELQCKCMIECVINAPSELPAALKPVEEAPS